jgi:hypothetical protein
MARTDLYRHFDKKGRLLYVGQSLNAVSRLQQHRGNSGWYNEIAYIKIEKFETYHDALDAERKAIERERPLYNCQSNQGRKVQPKSTVRRRCKRDDDAVQRVLDQFIDKNPEFGPKLKGEIPADRLEWAQALYNNKALTRQQVADRIEAETGVRLTRGQLATRFRRK